LKIINITTDIWLKIITGWLTGLGKLEELEKRPFLKIRLEKLENIPFSG